MNYRHIFHAGNFADVFKHWILTLILEKLIEKPTPFCVIDSHAGLGLYNLNDPQAQKTLEYASGVELFLKKAPDPSFAAYYRIASKFMSGIGLYPGSPAIIQDFLRADDRLWCSELHPQDYLVLQQNLEGDSRVKILHQDGYQSIRALLPPAQRRGLVFIDPPFEEKDEVEQLINALQNGLKRFAHGIYAVWYPIKDQGLVQKFYRELIALDLPESFYVEFHANSTVSNQLSSCGVLLINPPWQLDAKLKENLPLLLKYLDLEHGRFKIAKINT